MLRPLRKGLLGKLLLIMVVPVVFFGAAKAYVYFQAKHAIDEAADILSGKVEITYGDIDTSFGGDVVYKELEVRPSGGGQVIKIGRLMLRDLPVSELIGFGERLPGDQDFSPPSRARVLVRDVLLPLDSLTSSLSAEQRVNNDPCTSTGIPDEQFLRGVGFTELRGNGEFSYNFNPGAHEVRVSSELEVEGMERVRVELSLTDVEFDFDNAKIDAPPSLAGLLFSMRIEPAYARRAVRYCAEKLKLKPADYIRGQIHQINARIRGSGIALGSGLQTAVNEYLAQWGDLQLRVRPEQPIGLLSLVMGPKDEINKRLGVELVVNDRLITDTAFQLIAPTDDDVPSLAEVLGQAPPRAMRREQRKVAPKFERRYVQVATSELPRYKGYEVRIHTLNRPTREGWLKNLTDSEATVEQRVHGGHFSIYVQRNQITKVEVRKRVRVHKG